MTRLKYFEKDGYVQTDLVLIGEKWGYVLIDLGTLTYSIYYVNENEPVKIGYGKSLVQVKTKARNAAITLGLKVFKEVRQSKNREKFVL